ncbi:MAG TPA: BlaI/MecI/CopY family transcriptional regulator [Thermoanaerobaculia bacterium]|nr:BlaI/MecI/CopY family transcriptional regulator [Thermoanaerobaculia bacterium]
MKRQQQQLTRFELEVMEILWRLGESSIRQVQEAIAKKKRPAYTTVQTIFLRLEQKGAVRRTRKIGNAFLFEPVMTRQSAYRRMVDQLLELFGGSAQPVVSHLMETGKLTLEDLRAIEQAAALAEEHEGKR